MVSKLPARTPFAEVDQLPPHYATLVISSLEAMAAHPEIRRVRRVAWAALRPQPGHRLLDAGCGAGEVARELAAVVAPDGEVVALDYSDVTVATAAQRHDGSPVRYQTGDVAALTFPDGSFDGVRSERVLQHLTDPDGAIAELVRVTRPGGRVCLVDTDWDSLGVDGLPQELLSAIRAHLYNQSMLHHRDIGRTLRRRLVRAGLTDVTATPVTCCFDRAGSAGVVLPMFSPLVPPDVGLVPDGIRNAWFSAIDEADRRNELVAVLTIWVAAGTTAV